MNPYQAMGNNPINFIDPMGTDLTGRISRESFAAYLVKTKGFEEAQKWIYQQRQIEALGISTALEVYNMPILLGDKIAFDLGITKREGQFSKIANIALIVAPIAGLAWKALGYEGKITQAISGLSNFLKRINTRFGNAGRIGSSKLMNLVRNKLPPLNKFHSIEFDFLKLKTLKKGTRLYRSPFDPTTELVSDPGTWFGTRLTKTKTGTDSMYQLNKVKNALSEMRIYELTEDVTLFYGKVKGGTGYQVKFPSDIDPKEILRYIGKEKLK